MSRGTARREPICPRLAAAAWRTLTPGSESASTRLPTAAGSFMEPSITAAKSLISSSGSERSARSGAVAAVPSRT